MAVAGLQALNRKLKALPIAAKTEMERAVVESADRVAVLARALAPEEEGDLIASIRVEPGRHELARNIVAGGPLTTREVRQGSGAEYDYALGQEFGTAEMPANPFLYPAFRALKRSIKARLSRAVRRSIKAGQ